MRPILYARKERQKTAGAYKSGNLLSFIRPEQEITYKLNTFLQAIQVRGHINQPAPAQLYAPPKKHTRTRAPIRSSRPSVVPKSRTDKCAHTRFLNGCPCPTGCDMTNERSYREPQATRHNESWRRKRVRNRSFFTPNDDRAVLKRNPRCYPGVPLGGELN